MLRTVCCRRGLRFSLQDSLRRLLLQPFLPCFLGALLFLALLGGGGRCRRDLGGASLFCQSALARRPLSRAGRLGAARAAGRRACPGKAKMQRFSSSSAPALLPVGGRPAGLTGKVGLRSRGCRRARRWACVASHEHDGRLGVWRAGPPLPRLLHRRGADHRLGHPALSSVPFKPCVRAQVGGVWRNRTSAEPTSCRCTKNTAGGTGRPAKPAFMKGFIGDVPASATVPRTPTRNVDNSNKLATCF